MRVALDTNILAYAEGVNGAARKRAALAIVEKLPEGSVLLPVQVLGELFNLLVRKAKRPPTKAQRAILSWNDAFPVVETSERIMLAAAELSGNHQLSIWDSVVLAAAAESGCRLLLSEDLQEGFSWQGVTVTNPFSTPQHSLLAGLLAQQGS